MSYQLESFFGDSTSTTGSISSRLGTKAAEALPPEHDLAYAKAAASEVLRRGEKDASLDWENPQTGARGTVTPIASAYTQDGQTCRDFLASYVRETVQSWMQGEACQDKGAWQVRALKPWKKS
jgi:surface antigen